MLHSLLNQAVKYISLIDRVTCALGVRQKMCMNLRDTNGATCLLMAAATTTRIATTTTMMILMLIGRRLVTFVASRLDELFAPCCSSSKAYPSNQRLDSLSRTGHTFSMGLWMEVVDLYRIPTPVQKQQRNLNQRSHHKNIDYIWFWHCVSTNSTVVYLHRYIRYTKGSTYDSLGKWSKSLSASTRMYLFLSVPAFVWMWILACINGTHKRPRPCQ